jgi:hypothetical protein
MYEVLSGKKDKSIVSQAPFRQAESLEFMTFLNQEGLANDYIFLGFKGGFELRDPRDLTREILTVSHYGLQNIRNVEFSELKVGLDKEESTWYMAILCGFYCKKNECEKYSFHQYKIDTFTTQIKDDLGVFKKDIKLRVIDETH